jgi:hypothetical protein
MAEQNVISINDPRVKPVAEQVESLVDQVKTFAVTTPEHYENGAAVLMGIKGMAAKVEAQRKKITQPIDQAKKEVMDLFRPLTTALENAERDIKSRLVSWKSEQDRIAREAQRKADEQARKERERLERQAAEAEAAGKSARAETLRERAEVVVAAPPAPVVPQVSGISSRSNWKFRIKDATKINPLFMTPNEKKIGEAVRALKGDSAALIGEGIEVWSEDSLGARRA